MLLLLGLLAGFVLLRGFRSSGSDAAARDESSPQFLGAPGVEPKQGMLWGEPNRQLYPAIDDPKYVGPAEAEGFLEPEDRVLLLSAGGGFYVFPEVLLASYHVVNDVIDGEPLAITLCLLARSATVFSRRVGDRVLTLGLTGQLYCGNSVLYDKETETDWLQVNGEPLRGHFYGEARLASRPLERSSWSMARQRLAGEGHAVHVLAPIRPMSYYREFLREMEAERFGVQVVESTTTLDPRLLPYTRGLGLEIQGEACYYPENPYGSARAFQDTLGGWAVLIVDDPVEGGFRVFRRRFGERVLEFEMEGDTIVDRETGSRWNDRGRCIEGPLAGTQLERPFYTELYWFVWSALYPDTRVQS